MMQIRYWYGIDTNCIDTSVTVTATVTNTNTNTNNNINKEKIENNIVKQELNQSLTEVKPKFNKSLDSIEENSIVQKNVEEKNVAEITKCYEENIGLITPATAELLFDYLKDLNKELIIKAIKIASINNKRTMKYIKGILDDWIRKGFKTLLDIEQEENNFKNKNKPKKEETLEEQVARYKKEWGITDEDWRIYRSC